MPFTAQPGSFNPFGRPAPESERIAAQEEDAIQTLGESGTKRIDKVLSGIQEGIYLASVGRIEEGAKLVSEMEGWVGDNHAALANVAAHHPVLGMRKKVESLLVGGYRQGLQWDVLFNPERNPATDLALASKGANPALISLISHSNTSPFSKSLRSALAGDMDDASLTIDDTRPNGQTAKTVVGRPRYDASWMQNATAIIPEMVPEFEDVIATAAPDGTKTIGPEGRPFLDVIRTSVQMTRGTETDLDGNMAGSRTIAKSIFTLGRKLSANGDEWGKMSQGMRARTLQDISEAFKEATSSLDAADRADVIEDFTKRISSSPGITAQQATKAIRDFGSIYARELADYRDPETGKVDVADMAEAFESSMTELATQSDGAALVAGSVAKRTPSEQFRAAQDRDKRAGLQAAYRQAGEIGDTVGRNVAKAGLLANGALRDARNTLRRQGVSEADLESKAAELAKPMMMQLALDVAPSYMEAMPTAPDVETVAKYLMARWSVDGDSTSAAGLAPLRAASEAEMISDPASFAGVLTTAVETARTKLTEAQAAVDQWAAGKPDKKAAPAALEDWDRQNSALVSARDDLKSRVSKAEAAIEKYRSGRPVPAVPSVAAQKASPQGPVATPYDAEIEKLGADLAATRAALDATREAMDSIGNDMPPATAGAAALKAWKNRHDPLRDRFVAQSVEYTALARRHEDLKKAQADAQPKRMSPPRAGPLLGLTAGDAYEETYRDLQYNTNRGIAAGKILSAPAAVITAGATGLGNVVGGAFYDLFRTRPEPPRSTVATVGGSAEVDRVARVPDEATQIKALDEAFDALGVKGMKPSERIAAGRQSYELATKRYGELVTNPVFRQLASDERAYKTFKAGQKDLNSLDNTINATKAMAAKVSALGDHARASELMQVVGKLVSDREARKASIDELKLKHGFELVFQGNELRSQEKIDAMKVQGRIQEAKLKGGMAPVTDPDEEKKKEKK